MSGFKVGSKRCVNIVRMGIRFVYRVCRLKAHDDWATAPACELFKCEQLDDIAGKLSRHTHTCKAHQEQHSIRHIVDVKSTSANNSVNSLQCCVVLVA